MIKLVCLSGMNKGEEFEIPEGEFTIGRGEEASIHIIDKKASRIHGKVVRAGGVLTYQDIGSTNGSRVNNAFILGAKILSSGDHIHIGETVFLVAGDGSNAAQQPEALFECDETCSQKVVTRPSQTNKYGVLLQDTAFKLSDTAHLRRMRKERAGRRTGYVAFYQVEKANG